MYLRGEITNIHKILVGKHEGEKSVRKHRRGWESSIKMYLKGIRHEIVE
jgi:hypothetical protein